MSKDNDITFPRVMMVGLSSNEETSRMIEMMVRDASTPLIAVPYFNPTPVIDYPHLDDTMFKDHDPLFTRPPAIHSFATIGQAPSQSSNARLKTALAVTALIGMTQRTRLVTTVTMREEAKRLERMIQHQPHRGDLKLKLIALRNKIRETEAENARHKQAKGKRSK